MVAFMPLWLLVIVGSFLVGVSSVFGPVVLSTLDGRVQAIKREIEELKGRHKDKIWNRTVRYHQQLSSATVLLALSDISSEPKRKLVLEQAAANAIGLVVDSLAVVLGSTQENGDRPQLYGKEARELLQAVGTSRSFPELERDLRDGDVGAYRDVEEMWKTMIGYAELEMKQVEEERGKLSDRLQRIQWWKATTQYAVTSLSLIGITLVLLGSVFSRLAPAPPTQTSS